MDKKRFQEKLDGFSAANVGDLVPGGYVRYSVHSRGSDLYRLGGVLTYVDPQHRFLRLKNPHSSVSWSVQLVRAPGETLQLYFRPKESSIDPWKRLLRRLEDGELTIEKLRK